MQPDEKVERGYTKTPLVHPKMKILPSFTQPRDVANLYFWAQKKIFWRMLVTKQLTIAIEFHSIEKNKDIIKISSFVCNRRKTTTWLQHFLFFPYYPFKYFRDLQSISLKSNELKLKYKHGFL